ncbi:MAG: PD-(D/E)XK nuclease domain-containing protein, partial [Gammaproteobacteria bacterium]|nr:PD-(D/E)XK nuclease domain-containing protein [Gammaproteobacteria bacterium]
GDERVYNPFNILLLFRTREFRSHWYETGTPTFLYETMMAKGASPLELENRPIGEGRLTQFDVGDIDLRALMFQTGYLTIAEEERRGASTFYTLESPNLEVRASFSEGLLAHLGRDEAEVSEQGPALLERLEANDFDGFNEQLHACLAGLPHQWRDSGYLGQYESHYAAMLYLTFRAVGADVRAEEASLQGRADMVLLHGGQVFVLEFKMAKDGQDAEVAMAEAMGQMRRRGYADKYRAGNEPVHLIGVVFGSQERNLLAVRAEPA